MQGRLNFKYRGQEFIEGEFVLVNGKDVGYIGGVDKEKDGSETAYVSVYDTIEDWSPQYCNPWQYGYRLWYMTKFSSKKGDVIEKANINDYKPQPEPVKYGKLKPNSNWLLDGWVICIILMIVTLVLKPFGLWQLMILGTWLIIRKNEIDRINKK